MIPRVVLDTNIVLASLSTKSQYSIVIDKLFAGAYYLVTTTDILLEYEEKIPDFYNIETADAFIDALILQPNVIQCHPLFKTALVSDPDDNKFLDAYYSGKANILVTNDKKFLHLKQIEYPPHHIMNMKEFVDFLNNKPQGPGDPGYAMAA
ncbi:MAG TPA: putative toxin-antitoxin system toxin component, PIN family [Chitinophagales bacterium]|nr:putative toxin-antitoxin system toxin component, PIN family [Chitinophagales bacterium]